MRIIKIIPTFLIIATLISLLAGPAAALEYPDVAARNVVLIETTSGNTVFTKAEEERAYPASLTKIMTVLLAVEAIERGRAGTADIVTASNNITFDLIPDGSTANIVPGEEMPLIDLLYCAMLASANEACNIIAEYVGGTISEFVAMMNDKAIALGCTGTRFTNTHGIPDAGHYTTARDMSLIAKEAIRHPLFMEIVGTKEITIDATNMHETRALENSNALLGDNRLYKGYTYEDARGIKTGHTSDAGYCLVSTAVRDGYQYLAVVMGCAGPDEEDQSRRVGSFTNSVTLYNWAFASFSYRNVLEPTETIASVAVDMGSDAERVNVHPERSVSALLPNDLEISSLQRSFTIYSERDKVTLKAPINRGDVLGEITVSYEGQVLARINLVAASDISLSKMVYIRAELSKLMRSKPVIATIITLLLLVFAYVFLVVRYRILRRRHVKTLRQAQRVRESLRADETDGEADKYTEEFYK